MKYKWKKYNPPNFLFKLLIHENDPPVAAITISQIFGILSIKYTHVTIGSSRAWSQLVQEQHSPYLPYPLITCNFFLVSLTENLFSG